MVGQKTHEQQQRIIKRQENTRGGGDAFPAEEDLKSSKNARDAKAKGAKLATPAADLVDPDDRSMLRGRDQESRRH